MVVVNERSVVSCSRPADQCCPDAAAAAAFILAPTTTWEISALTLDRLHVLRMNNFQLSGS